MDKNSLDVQNIIKMTDEIFVLGVSNQQGKMYMSKNFDKWMAFDLDCEDQYTL